MSKSVLKSHLQNFNMPSNFYSIILTPYNSLVIKSRVFRFVVLIRFDHPSYPTTLIVLYYSVLKKLIL